MVMGLAKDAGPSVFVGHERTLPAPPERIGRLVDALGSPDDALWPADRWPALQLDKPLQVGARGGHGPMRYHVVAHEPGTLVRFRFTGPPGFVGEHEFLVERAGRGASRLRHALTLRPIGNARLTWPLFYAPLHDALIEDLMDRAEAVVKGEPYVPREWSRRVRFLRRIAKRWGERRPGRM